MAMDQNNLWTGFQMPRRLAVETRDTHRALRPLLGAAVRARLRHDHRQLSAPRAALFDRGRGHHGRQDRGRRARVLLDPRRGRRRDRRHPESEAGSVQAHGTEAKTLTIHRDGAGEVTSADIEADADVEMLDPIGLHRDRQRRRLAEHRDAPQARPRLRFRRPQLRRRPVARLHPDRLGPHAGQEGQLHGRGRAPRARTPSSTS